MKKNICYASTFAIITVLFAVVLFAPGWNPHVPQSHAMNVQKSQPR